MKDIVYTQMMIELLQRIQELENELEELKGGSVPTVSDTMLTDSYEYPQSKKLHIWEVPHVTSKSSVSFKDESYEVEIPLDVSYYLGTERSAKTNIKFT